MIFSLVSELSNGTSFSARPARSWQDFLVRIITMHSRRRMAASLMRFQARRTIWCVLFIQHCKQHPIDTPDENTVWL